jgi:NAD(P)-dependent dehydrogenase (short-subunit alcohol dehydrogenase family)
MMNERALPSAFDTGNVAIVTGAASGIGLAAARAFAQRGMKAVLVDRTEAVQNASREVGGAAAFVIDVSRREDVMRLRDEVLKSVGPVSVLMNNAGVGNNPGLPWADSAAWKALIDVNLWGVVHGVEAFVPGMLASRASGVVINTGSKQGITSPPGNAAYNMSKAALRSYTESLAHALRNQPGTTLTAHLLIPGFTFTGMTGATEKPADAWTAEQVVAFMLDSVAAGDFYILCPDNAVDRAMDERRMRWAMDDIVLNRPALSRWHPEFAAAFAEYMGAK